MKTKKRRRFSREYKLDVVRMVTDGGHRVSDVAKELEIRADMIRRWVKRFGEGAPSSSGGVSLEERDGETAKLRRELSRVREERDILKKAVAIFSDRRP